MTTKEALVYFGGHAKLGRQIGLGRHATKVWGKYPRPAYQVLLENLSGGDLKAENWARSENSMQIYRKENSYA